MNYVLVNWNRKVFSFDPYTHSYYFADDFNDYQIELTPTSIIDLKQDEGELDSIDETLKLYISIAGTWLYLNLAP
jgi:hypothetical protein